MYDSLHPCEPGSPSSGPAPAGSACAALLDMGFLDGVHANGAEDGYMSYRARLLGVPLELVHHSGSWWRRCQLLPAWIGHLEAIHPLTRGLGAIGAWVPSGWRRGVVDEVRAHR